MGATLGEANVMRGRGDLYLAENEFAPAREAYGAALERYTSATNQRGRAYALWGLAQVSERGDGAAAVARGQYQRAVELFEYLGLKDEAEAARRDLMRVSPGGDDIRL